jgi:hypothetical protein
VPGLGIPGNESETADFHARRGAGSELIGPEPFLGLSTQVVRTLYMTGLLRNSHDFGRPNMAAAKPRH